MRTEQEIAYFSRVFGRSPIFDRLLDEYISGKFNPKRQNFINVELPDVWVEPGEEKPLYGCINQK